MKASKIRGLTALVAVVGLTAVGLATDAGTGTLSAFGVESVAAVCPVGALESMFGAREASLHGLACLGVTVLVVAVVGKALCAWACPVPWLQRFFRPSKRAARAEARGKAPADARGAERGGACEMPCDAMDGGVCEATCGACANGGDAALPPVGGARDGVHLDSRHIVLGGACASSLLFGFPVFCLVCPVGLTFATIIGLWNLLRFDETTWGLLLFPAILVAEAVLLRKWCATLCPIGALVSLLSNLNRTLRPRVDGKRCLRERGVDCRACVEACLEQVDPHSARIPECTKCRACVEACPVQAVRFFKP